MPDIYDYAQQAGFVPSAPQLPDFGLEQPALEQPSLLRDPNFGGLTDEDLLAAAGVAPAQEPSEDRGAASGSAEGPITQPSQLNDGLLPPIPAPTKTKQGVSVSRSGFSPSKNAQVRRGPGAALDRRIGAIEDQGAERLAVQQAPFVAANDEAVAAAHATTAAEVEQLTALGHQKALLARLQTDFDTRTNELMVLADAETKQAKADYVAALTDYRAQRVNPAQLWDNMTGGEHVGMLAAAFVQDFLGARGIQTSAMATFNKAIDRNIDSQIQNIKMKGDVAQGFKTLWDMQVAESKSMQEARTRMRGFMLEGARTAVEAHMAQFDAALVTAKGQAAIAKLDEELAKNIFDVTKHVDAATSQRVSQEIQRYGDELRASMDAARIAVDRERLAIEKKKQQGEFDPYSGLIFDVSESGQGAPVAEFNADIKSEERQKFREKQAAAAKLVQLNREYMSLVNKHGNQGPTGGTRWQDTDTAKLRNVAYEILNTRIKLQTGAAMNESEAERIKTSTPEALFGTQYNIRAVLGQTQRHIQDELAINQQTMSRPLHPQDPRRTLANPRVIQGQPEYKEAGIIEMSQEDAKDIDKAIMEGRLKGLEPHFAFKPYTGFLGKDDVAPYIQEDHKRFLADNPALVSKHEKDIKIAPGLTNVTKGPMNFEAKLSQLAETAKGYRERAAERKPEERDEAELDMARYVEHVKILKHEAAPVISGTNPDDIKGRYALMKLRDLGEAVESAGTEQIEGSTGVIFEAPPSLLGE